MSWLEQTIRRYEHRRWTRDDNRLVRPFEWGLEHVGGPSNGADPRPWLEKWVEATVASSDDWYAAEATHDYQFDGDTLTFTSAVHSPWPTNNRVTAYFWPALKSGPAVVVLPHWNAKPHEYNAICRWLNRLGITALRMVMPYHETRVVTGHERADQLVGTNVGLTLQANRQAVTDARRCLRWLEQQGYGKLGILGTSIGSSIGFITMCHDRAVRAGAFLHVSTFFGDVVRTGMTTMHVWESLRAKVTAEEIQRY
ncbi:MAG: dienelactone hydrolase family protein, partial [Candidatus Acidiferrales bacterium]